MLVPSMMLKIPSGAENASIELTEVAVGNEDSIEERNKDGLHIIKHEIPLLYLNDGVEPIPPEVKKKRSVADKGDQAIRRSKNVDETRFGIEKVCEDVNGNTEVRTNMEEVQSKTSEMDLSGGRTLCCQHGEERYNHHVRRDKSLALHKQCIAEEVCRKLKTAAIHEDATMHQKSAQNTVSKEFIETYCRTLEELERCRGRITKLSQENNALVEKLKEYRWDRECHRTEMQAEKQFRERIQNDLRKIVKDMECHQPEVWTAPNATASPSNDIDIEYFKDQLRVYQEDFKQEKDEKLKLRELNSLLTTELEEAKQTIESQQKKLLVYAQIFSNGPGAQVVIPPAYIGRRVRSNPSSPSYNHLHSMSRHAKQFSELHDDFDQNQRTVEYDPIYDVVPKGSTKIAEKIKQPIERRTSVP